MSNTSANRARLPFNRDPETFERLGEDAQRQRIIDEIYDGDEERYRQAARAVYDKARQKVEESLRAHPDYDERKHPNRVEYTFTAVHTGGFAEWSKQPDGPVKWVYTAPTGHVVGTLFTPTDAFETQISPDEYENHPDLMTLGTGRSGHPVIREVELLLSDPNQRDVLPPERADLETESFYY